MTARLNDDRLLSAWLHDIAPAREPEHLLGEVLARTARTRRRAPWRIPERWNPMSAITSRFAPTTPVPWRILAVTSALLLALVASLALLASGAFDTKAPPYGLAHNGQIYYSDGSQLFARSADGTVTNVASGFAPVLSPDGTRLTFLRPTTGGNALWTANLDGSNARQLQLPGPDIGWFEWSPDGDSAVVVIDSQPNVLTIIPTDGGDPATHDIGVFIDQPVFRPTTGSQVAFLGKVGEDRGIYLVGRDGSNLVKLDLDPGYELDENYDVDKCCYFWAMSWSPTGDRLLYTTLEPAPGSPAGAGFRNHLATIGSTGNVISDEILEFDAATDDEFVGAWTPSGDGMVFQNVEGTKHWLSYAELGPSGAGPARDLGIEANDWIGSQVSPDGTQLIVVMPAPEGTPQVVYLVELASGTRTQVDLGSDAAWQRLAP